MENDFMIRRSIERIESDDIIKQMVYMKRALLSPRRAIKIMSQFVFENQEFEFYYDLILAKRYMNEGNRVKSEEMLELIRETFYKRWVGSILLSKRIHSQKFDVGTLEVLPLDIILQF